MPKTPWIEAPRQPTVARRVFDVSYWFAHRDVATSGGTRLRRAGVTWASLAGIAACMPYGIRYDIAPVQ
jgi:hypothetical protein